MKARGPGPEPESSPARAPAPKPSRALLESIAPPAHRRQCAHAARQLAHLDVLPAEGAEELRVEEEARRRALRPLVHVCWLRDRVGECVRLHAREAPRVEAQLLQAVPQVRGVEALHRVAPTTRAHAHRWRLGLRLGSTCVRERAGADVACWRHCAALPCCWLRGRPSAACCWLRAGTPGSRLQFTRGHKAGRGHQRVGAYRVVGGGPRSEM